MSVATLTKAAEAGAEILDTVISSLAMGTSHSPTETMVEIFKGTEYDTGLDTKLLLEIAAYFREVRKNYKKFESSFLGADTRILASQVPGGMLSNLESQLKEQGASDKIDEVLKEIAVVQKDAGYPPLVTPTSQIVGTQAVFNVLFGSYNRLSGEFQDLMAGKYGACPAPKNADVVKKALEGLKMEKEITHRPADDIPPEYDKLEAEAKKLLGTETVSVEDVLTLAMFPKVAPNFFKKRAEGPVVFKPEAEAPAAPAGSSPAGAAPGQAARYTVNVNGANYNVVVAPAGTMAVTAAPAPGGSSVGGVAILAPVAGTILRYAVDEGAEVTAGQTVIIIESMKMELEIKSTAAGRAHFLVPAGAQVASQQPVAEIAGAGVPVPSSAEVSPAEAGGTVPAGDGISAAGGSATVIPAPVAGTLLRYAVNEGAHVASGDTVVIIESMKMELEIKAAVSGAVHFLVQPGAQIASQQPIAEIA
jgi:oxaloacetate decarboxylase alpha subunit